MENSITGRSTETEFEDVAERLARAAAFTGLVKAGQVVWSFARGLVINLRAGASLSRSAGLASVVGAGREAVLAGRERRKAMLANFLKGLLVGFAAGAAVEAVSEWDREATERAAREAEAEACRRRAEAASRARTVYDSYSPHMSPGVRDAYRRRCG